MSARMCTPRCLLRLSCWSNAILPRETNPKQWPTGPLSTGLGQAGWRKRADRHRKVVGIAHPSVFRFVVSAAQGSRSSRDVVQPQDVLDAATEISTSDVLGSLEGASVCRRSRTEGTDEGFALRDRAAESTQTGDVVDGEITGLE